MLLDEFPRDSNIIFPYPLLVNVTIDGKEDILVVETLADIRYLMASHKLSQIIKKNNRRDKKLKRKKK